MLESPNSKMKIQDIPNEKPVEIQTNDITADKVNEVNPTRKRISRD